VWKPSLLDLPLELDGAVASLERWATAPPCDTREAPRILDNRQGLGYPNFREPFLTSLLKNGDAVTGGRDLTC
jgi:hypothetical protein